jgi:hypothetical protein
MLGGCGLYWNNGGGEDDVCNGGAAPPQPAQSYRDPQTGQCEAVPTPDCGVCECAGVAEPANPGWATCPSSCSGLGQIACEETGSCQAEFLDTDGTTSFWGCFGLSQFGASTGACNTLDAYACSARGDCTATYRQLKDNIAGGATTEFESCGPVMLPPPPPPPPACDTLTTEADCTARGDCDAIYDGYDCTCDPSGCTCQTETYARCQSR